MYNPLTLLSGELLETMIASGNRYFVRQSYLRGQDQSEAAIKAVFIISQYKDQQEALAHYQAIANDPYKFMYDIEKEGDREKLFHAAGQPEGYKVYANILKDDWVPSEQMAQHIRSYVGYKLKWKSGRRDELKVNLCSEFGNLFLRLKLNKEEAKVPLADIERM